MFERTGRPNRVQAPEQLPQAIELVEVARLRRAATATGKQGETKPGVFVQTDAVVNQRRYHRHVAFGQFEGEAVLFQNRFVGPALRAIELGDQRLGVFDTHLIDTVFIAVEGQHTGVAEQAHAFNSIEHQIGCEGFKRMGHADSCAAAGLPRPAQHGSAKQSGLIGETSIAVRGEGACSRLGAQRPQ